MQNNKTETIDYVIIAKVLYFGLISSSDVTI
jgi:hypothetical protein